MKPISRVMFLSLAGLIFAAFAQAGTGAPASDTIPNGTKITQQNWRQYQAFMPAGMQALFEGKYHWKMPPDVELVVGSTVTHPLPPAYMKATERYASQVKLVPTSDGGLWLQNYVAGMPFPNPAPPEMGWKILANHWFRYIPHLVVAPPPTLETLCTEDRFGSRACSSSAEVYRQLRHVADSLDAKDVGDDAGPFYTEYWQVQTPEDKKYTTGLTLYYDGSRLQDTYLFLPQLRRTIRINPAARCAQTGNDFTEDDWRYGFSGDIWTFQAKFLERKKILALINFSSDAAGRLTDASYYMPLLWPRPSWAKWELRDAYVIDVASIPSHAKGYCYGRRVMYLDSTSYVLLWQDLYDSDKNLWKTWQTGARARDVRGAGIQDSSGSRVTVLWDLKGGHLSFLSTVNAEGGDFLVNESVPKKWDDVHKYSGLAGLSEILR
jgi:hypothetical protein